MKIGLFFGSFNPVHIGHMAIANYMVEFTDIEQLWFVVSPQNPLKKKKSLLNNVHRLEMVEMAIGKDDRLLPCDIEFYMPTPSYTIDTLTYLKEKHRNDQFILIMGSDGLRTFNKWKNFKEIQENYTRYVYPRPGTLPEEFDNQVNIKKVEAPLMEISSSFIRKAIKENKNINYFLPPKVYDHIINMHFYE